MKLLLSSWMFSIGLALMTRAVMLSHGIPYQTARANLIMRMKQMESGQLLRSATNEDILREMWRRKLEERVEA